MAAAGTATRVAVPPPALGLTTIDHEGQLLISWDRHSGALLHAHDATLTIVDGASPKQVLRLDLAHLQSGSFTYARQAEKIEVELAVPQPGAADVREVVSFLGKLPDHKTSEAPEVQQQRDELAREAAKLKDDLNAQAVRTKRLEKDLNSMREEMRQQQLKRLNNQLPDK